MRQECVRGRSLLDLCIPGSHDSASYRTHYAGGIAASWAFTHGAQDSILQQLNNGVRWLDFRVVDVELATLYDSCMHCKNPSRVCRLWTAHTLLCVPLCEVVRDIRRFLRQPEASGEVVVASLVEAKADGRPQMDVGSWILLLQMFEDALGEEALLVRDDLRRPLDDLRVRGKRLCLIVRGCPLADSRGRTRGGRDQLVAYEDMVVQSWEATQAKCPTALQRNLHAWLGEKQPEIGRRERFFWLNCELTPPPLMIADSMLYVSLTADNYLLLEDCCMHAQRVLREGFARRWRGLKLSVVTTDFCSPETSMFCIARNFPHDIRESIFCGLRESLSSSPH